MQPLVTPETTSEQKVDQARTRREVFEYSLAAILEQLNPERAICAFQEHGELTAQATHNFDPQTVFVAGEISTELIKTIMRDGQGMCLVDAHDHPGLSNRTSVILSGLRSIVCVPIIQVQESRHTIGLLYADNRIRAGAFDAQHQQWLESLAQRMAARLAAVENPSPSVAASVGQSTAADQESWQRLRQEALLHFREKRQGQAIQSLFQAVEIAETFDNVDPRLGQTLGELAEMQRQQGDSVDAERNFIRAIGLLEQQGTGARHALAPVLTNLATLYFSQGNGIRAEGLYRRALETWTAQLAPLDRRLAPLYFNLATLRKTAGDIEDARQLFTTAVKIAESAWGLEHAHTLRCRKALDDLSTAAH